MIVQHLLQAFAAAGIVTLIVFVIAHDVDYLGKAITDLFEKGLTCSAHSGIVSDIHGLANVASKNQHIGCLIVGQLNGAKLKMDV
jgi:hypothetical protein